MSAEEQAGRRCTILLRIDCEHTEAARWARSIAVEHVGIRRLLALLDNLHVPATFALVGTTALEFPELARAVEGHGHAIAGHSMHHAGSYAGRPERWQQQDMCAMVQSIQQACGVRVRGLAAPDHGRIDEQTIRAAARAGLDYLLNFTFTVDQSDFGPIPGLPETVRVPPSRMRAVWDWTALQPGWPDFSAAEAAKQWREAVSASTRENGLVSLILHPWIVQTNDEYGLIADFLGAVRQQGARFATFDELVGTPVEDESAVVSVEG